MTADDSGAPQRPCSPQTLLDRLAAMGIEAETLRHPPVFTVEEARALRGDLPGAHIKNLFLRDKKQRMWLLVCLADTKVDLKQLAARLGSKGLSFASAERLLTYWGVTPGAVTPFGAVNDSEGAVQVVLERAILTHERVNCHPLDNAMTTNIATADLLRFLEATAHPPQFIELAESGAAA
mgnify:CR=1 FL=1